AAKKPRLRLSMRRSSSVRPSREFHSALSACMDTSVGIQWLLQAARYFSHAHRYLNGRSWFTSARALIMRLSSTETRAPPRSISPRPVESLSTSVAAGCLADAFVSAQLSIVVLLVSAYWQASHSGSSIEQALPHAALEPTIGAGATAAETALSLPSVPFSVDFSTWVADRERR